MTLHLSVCKILSLSVFWNYLTREEKKKNFLHSIFLFSWIVLQFNFFSNYYYLHFSIKINLNTLFCDEKPKWQTFYFLLNRNSIFSNVIVIVCYLRGQAPYSFKGRVLRSNAQFTMAGVRFQTLDNRWKNYSYPPRQFWCVSDREGKFSPKRTSKVSC